jgi:F0F1-type ATP synthase assembly protein I
VPKKDPANLGGVGKYLGSAILLPIATLVGYAMGYGLDALFHTGWLRYVFAVLGTVAGMMELIKDLNEDT